MDHLDKKQVKGYFCILDLLYCLKLIQEDTWTGCTHFVHGLKWDGTY